MQRHAGYRSFRALQQMGCRDHTLSLELAVRRGGRLKGLGELAEDAGKMRMQSGNADTVGASGLLSARLSKQYLST